MPSADVEIKKSGGENFMTTLKDKERQTLGLDGMATLNFLEAEMARLLSEVKDEDGLRSIRQRGQKAFESLTGKTVKVGSLELTRATLGLGLMLSITDGEFTVIDDQLKQIRAMRDGGQ